MTVHEEGPRSVQCRQCATTHAIPTVLAVSKDRAQHFLRAWQRRVCPAELIYTRSNEGRLMLLQTRMRAFSNQASTQSRRLDRWF